MYFKRAVCDMSHCSQGILLDPDVQLTLIDGPKNSGRYSFTNIDRGVFCFATVALVSSVVFTQQFCTFHFTFLRPTKQTWGKVQNWSALHEKEHGTTTNNFLFDKKICLCFTPPTVS